MIYQNNTEKEIVKVKTISQQKIEKCKETKREIIEIDEEEELTDQEAILKAKETLKLSRVDKNGVSIKWSIDTNESDIKLVATLSKNSIRDKKFFRFKIPKISNKDESDVEQIVKKITPDFIKVNNESLEEVTSNLNLPEIGMDGSKIVWKSDNPNVVSNKGVVVRPSFNKDEIEVTLTAIITKDGEEIEKKFSIIVLPDESEIREVK
jgi:hypothetical protein